MRIIDQLCQALAEIPGVTAATSRFGGRGNRAWSVGGKEFEKGNGDG